MRKSCSFHDAEGGLIHLAHAKDVEVYVSIGGSTLSAAFPEMAATQEGRENFAQSCVELILGYGFDGECAEDELVAGTEGSRSPAFFGGDEERS